MISIDLQSMCWKSILLYVFICIIISILKGINEFILALFPNLIRQTNDNKELLQKKIKRGFMIISLYIAICIAIAILSSITPDIFITNSCNPEIFPSHAITVKQDSITLDTNSFTVDNYLTIEEAIIISYSRKLTPTELSHFSSQDLFYIRNGIFAYMGRDFAEPDLLLYYSKYSWYTPYIAPKDFPFSIFNENQVYNIELIKNLEKSY